jgi:hypothetical protein
MLKYISFMQNANFFKTNNKLAHPTSGKINEALTFGSKPGMEYPHLFVLYAPEAIHLGP